MLKKSTIPLLAMVALLGTTPVANSAGELPSKEEMWKMLKQQQEEINALKQILSIQKNEPVAPAEPQNGEKKKDGLHWSDRITLSGVVDVRANAKKDYAKTRTSDIVIDTVKVNVDSKVTDLVSAHVTLLHEEAANGAGPEFVDVDEATITLGDPDKFPAYLTAGRMTVPFGKFTTNLINDPLTLQLAETKESVLQVGFNSEGFYGSGYAFNGNSQKAGHSDTIDQFGANLGFSGKLRNATLDIGASYINSIEDSEVLSSSIPTLNAMSRHIGGAGVHAVLGFQGFTLIGEYITATDRFDNAEVAWNGRGAKPKVSNLELDYEFEIMGKTSIASLAWQSSDEALALGFPANRIMTGLSMLIFDQTTVAVEWMHDKDYGTGSTATLPGTNTTANTGTVKLAVGF
ncbi:MAG: LbtU family siderophore porin [Magnetococcales bacterium]|nr:LbtU family siderophore porin [Magnetococcales bacterium]